MVDNKRSSRRLTGLPVFFAILLLIGLAAAYIGTTIELFNRSHAAQSANAMLSMKVEMLQTEVDTIDLSMVPTEQTTLLETGTCVMNDDFGPPAQALINYRYYSYTIGNLTRYYAEFNGGISDIPEGLLSSDPGCPGGVRTSRYRINIFNCLTDPARNSGVASLINQGFPGQSQFVHQSFTPADLTNIDYHGANDTVISHSFFTTGPCTPRMYTVTSGGDFSVSSTGPLYESLVVTWFGWTSAAGPFAVTLNNLRVPIPQSFQVG